MAQHKDYRNQGIYTVSQLVELTLNGYKIKLEGSKFKNACDRLRTILTENGIKGQIDPNQFNNTFYYKRNKKIDKVLTGEEFKKYLEKLTKNNDLNNPNTDSMLWKNRINSIKTVKKERKALREKLELSKEEARFLDLDKITEKQYLRMDEMEFLNKKGLVLRDSLNDEELENLEAYNRYQMQYEAEEERAEQLFQQKRLEFMVTALFNQSFILDEKKLREDIGTFVHSGEGDNALVTKIEVIDDDGSVIKRKIDVDIDVSRAYTGITNPEYLCNYVHKRND